LDALARPVAAPPSIAPGDDDPEEVPTMTDHEVLEVDAAAQAAAAIRARLSVPEIGRWFGPTLGRLAGWLDRRQLPIVGPPYARYHRLDGEEERFEVEAGFPVGAPIDGDDDVSASALPGGPHATTVHVGPYEELGAAYESLTTWVAAHGGEPAGDPWEIYESDPTEQPDPATWRTRVIMPFRRR
jgi:effector-binding domain-containing protein